MRHPLKQFMEIRFESFFPHLQGDLALHTIPIAHDYEGILARRVEQLSLLFGYPEFEDYLLEVIHKDLFEENPHWRSFEGMPDFLSLPMPNKGGLVLPEVNIPSPEERMRKKGAIHTRLEYGLLFGKDDGIEEKVALLCEAMEIGEREKGLLYHLMQLSTELASVGYCEVAIQLLKRSMDIRAIAWDSRKGVLVDQMGKIYFAHRDFVRAEMCFEENARRARGPWNTRPYYFHLGIMELANKHYDRAKDFLLRASNDFISPEVARSYNQAVEELFARITERRNDSRILGYK